MRCQLRCALTTCSLRAKQWPFGQGEPAATHTTGCVWVGALGAVCAASLRAPLSPAATAPMSATGSLSFCSVLVSFFLPPLRRPPNKASSPARLSACLSARLPEHRSSLGRTRGGRTSRSHYVNVRYASSPSSNTASSPAGSTPAWTPAKGLRCIYTR